MTSYIYITGSKIDPGLGKSLNDPIWIPTKSLGSCMPNIRKRLKKDDWVFVISGKNKNVSQYVIGGIKASEIIHATEAYVRFPENRLHMNDNGELWGNICVDSSGNQHPLDNHRPDTIPARAENFIIAGDSIYIASPREIEIARLETLDQLRTIFGATEGSMIDLVGRFGKPLNSLQEGAIIDWLRSIKRRAA